MSRFYWNSHKPHRGRQDRRRLGQLRRFRHDAAAGRRGRGGAGLWLEGVMNSTWKRLHWSMPAESLIQAMFPTKSGPSWPPYVAMLGAIEYGMGCGGSNVPRPR